MECRVFFVQFSAPNQPGDYRWHVSKEDKDAGYIFPDNTDKVGNSGAACIRSHPGAIGIPTIIRDPHTGLLRAFKDVPEALPYVEESLSQISECAHEGFPLFFPVGNGDESDILGCGTFDVPRDVRAYITARVMHKIRTSVRDGCKIVIDKRYMR